MSIYRRPVVARSPNRATGPDRRSPFFRRQSCSSLNSPLTIPLMEGYRIHAEAAVYYLTYSVVEWLPVGRGRGQETTPQQSEPRPNRVFSPGVAKARQPGDWFGLLSANGVYSSSTRTSEHRDKARSPVKKTTAPASTAVA